MYVNRLTSDVSVLRERSTTFCEQCMKKNTEKVYKTGKRSWVLGRQDFLKNSTAIFLKEKGIHAILSASN